MRKEDRLSLQLADYIYLQYPNIIAHFDVGSGGKMTIGMATRNKRLNKRRGFPDLFIAEPMGVFKGLFIEIKAQSPFKLNGELYAGQHLKEQQDMISALLLRGYYAEFGVGFDGCKLILDTYLKK